MQHFKWVAFIGVVAAALYWYVQDRKTERETFVRSVAADKWRRCSMSTVDASLKVDPARAAVEVRDDAWAQCLLHLASLSLADDAVQMAKERLLSVVERQIEQHSAMRKAREEGQRKELLIKAAIKSLEEQGIAEDDLKEYFRDDAEDACEETKDEEQEWAPAGRG